jgi:uncharacterized protein YndB with AHSA1/START domain
MEHSVYIRKRFNHPIEKVWKFITKSEYIEKWFLKVEELTLEKGSKYHLVGEPTETWDGNLYCEVIEVIENRKFVHTFKSNSMNESTEVTWLLESTEDGGTFLTLTHKGNENLKDLIGTIESVDSGWMSHLATLTKLINNQLEESC